MNYEIKEILEEIDNKIIPNEHWNKIKDYITNLQQEKDTSDDYARHLYNKNKKLQEENYKTNAIIEEAIEFIKNFKYGMPYTEWVKKEELLIILNGGDE